MSNEYILKSVKTAIGGDIHDEEDHFDAEITMHINSVFFILYQIGVGPEKPFVLRSETQTWDEFLQIDGDALELVKSYVYFRVRMMFDPPQSGGLSETMQKIIDELEWRLKIEKETWAVEGEEEVV